MRILCTIALFACLAGLAGSPAPSLAAPAAAPTPAASCPTTLLIESTNGKYYVAVFSSRAPARAQIVLTLYAPHAVYRVSLPDQIISQPIASRNYTYRSAPAVIKNLDDGQLLGATVAPAGDANGCPGENVIIPSVDSLTAPDRHLDPAADELEQQIASEAAKATIYTPVAASDIPAPSCSDPFDDAAVVTLTKPDLTPEQRANPDLGPITIRVDLDAAAHVTGAVVETSSGNSEVDQLALEAARKTTYSPAHFACQAERSSHELRIDFSPKS